MKRITAVGLAGLAAAGAGVAFAVGANEWNGLVKTDMASLLATRDVSQSTVISSPRADVRRRHQQGRSEINGMVGAGDRSEEGLAERPFSPHRR